MEYIAYIIVSVVGMLFCIIAVAVFYQVRRQHFKGTHRKENEEEIVISNQNELSSQLDTVRILTEDDKTSNDSVIKKNLTEEKLQKSCSRATTPDFYTRETTSSISR